MDKGLEPQPDLAAEAEALRQQVARLENELRQSKQHVACQPRAPAYMQALTADLLGGGDEGLNNQTKARIGRFDTCTSIVVRASLFGFQLLRGPPRSGKTSILQLLHNMVQQGLLGNFTEAIYINMGQMGNKAWPQFFMSYTASKDAPGKDWEQYSRRFLGGGAPGSAKQMTLLLLDDMQAAYSKGGQLTELLSYFKDIMAGNPGVTRIVMASVHGDSPSAQMSEHTSNCPPFGYGEEHIVDLLATFPDADVKDSSDAAARTAALVHSILKARHAGDVYGLAAMHERLKKAAPSIGFTRAEAEELWDAYWADTMHVSKLFSMASPSVKEHVFWATSGQVGVMLSIFKHLTEKVNEATKHHPPDNIGDHAYLEMCRSGSLYAAISAQRGFIKNVSECGEARLHVLDQLLKEDPEKGCSISRLTAQQFDALQSLKNSGHLCVQGATCRFWTPLHYLYYRNMVFCARLKPIGGSAGTLVDFLRLSMTRLSATQLRKTLSRRKGKGGLAPEEDLEERGLLERALQMQFYQVCFDLLPEACRIDSDVSQGGTGWVDFWISGTDWAVELLCDGLSLAEHERRFQPGGKYHLWPFQEYAVIDFRGAGAPYPSKPRDTPAYHVVFDDDYNSARCVDARSMAEVFDVVLCGDEKMAPRP